jgi:hypothetical protein
MDADETELLLCPVCGTDITAADSAFCGTDCRDRWRKERRERYARPPGTLADTLLRALEDELRAGD